MDHVERTNWQQLREARKIVWKRLRAFHAVLMLYAQANDEFLSKLRPEVRSADQQSRALLTTLRAAPLWRGWSHCAQHGQSDLFPLAIYIASGVALIPAGGANAQSTSEIAGTWSCPNFTLTIRAEGNTYLIHAALLSRIIMQHGLDHLARVARPALFAAPKSILADIRVVAITMDFGTPLPAVPFSTT
jgi:hypothetical protein